MANGQQLQKSLQASGRGFDSMLESVMGAFSSIKQSQVEKQRIQEELESQKDLIQFRSDVQLEQQKKVFEEIKKPQLEAERQQQLLEERREAFKDAQQTTLKLANKFSESQFRNVSKYNLLDPEFDIEPIQNEDGVVEGYRPSVKIFGQEVSQPDFVETLRKRAEFGGFISSLEESAEDGGLSQSVSKQGEIAGETFRFSTIGSDNIGDVVTQIKQDPQFRETMFEIWNRSGESSLVSKKEPEETGKDRKTPVTDLIPFIGKMRDQIKTGHKTYSFGEEGWWTDQDTTFTIDFRGSVAGVQNQINRALKETFFREDEEFDLSSLGNEARKAILSGDVGSIEENLEGKKQEWAVRLAEKTGGIKKQIDELVKFYNFYDYAYTEGYKVSQGTGGEGPLRSPSEVGIDLRNVPSDLSNIQQFRNIFFDVDEQEDKGRLNYFLNSFKQETEPALGIFGSNKRTLIDK